VLYVQLVTRVMALARRRLFDALVVLGAIDSALEVVLRHDDLKAPRTTGWLAGPAVAVIVLPLLARRRFRFAAPVAVWLVGAALSFADGRLVVFSGSTFAAGLAAAYLLGNLPDDNQGRIGLAVAAGGAAIVIHNDPSHSAGDFIFLPVLCSIVWLAGFALRERSAQAEAAEQRAGRAEAERAVTARIAVAEERARIARELHDIVAHSVSVMVLQVGAVRHNLPEALEEDSEALRGVEQTGRNALAEMRLLLGAMRREGDDLELEPQPGLGSLDALLEEVGRAGLPVRLHVDGEPSPLPRPIDLSAYRIVQEGLTNALKHAHAKAADVTIRYGPRELQIDVRDDGVGSAPGDGLGHGLVGMRERVTIYGGEMTAGAASGGGYLLSTRLPLDGLRQ
jgi:signal transduction histidine kinase